MAPESVRIVDDKQSERAKSVGLPEQQKTNCLSAKTKIIDENNSTDSRDKTTGKETCVTYHVTIKGVFETEILVNNTEMTSI